MVALFPFMKIIIANFLLVFVVTFKLYYNYLCHLFYFLYLLFKFCFQVYRNTESMTVADNTPVGSDYYFRLVFNGKDITNRIHFCRGGGSTTVMPIKKTSQIIYLCPIESIIRFLHDDYFMMLNTTNFKDACVVH